MVEENVRWRIVVNNPHRKWYTIYFIVIGLYNKVIRYKKKLLEVKK